MNTQSEMPTTEKRPTLVAGIAARFGTIAIFIILQAVILFLTAGRLTWTWARTWASTGDSAYPCCNSI